jgi:hypothetical protein
MNDMATEVIGLRSFRDIRGRTRGLAGARLHERLLDIGGEESAPAARLALLGLGLAVRDRPASFATEVLLTALRADDSRRFGKQLSDLAQLARDAKGVDPGSCLVRLDEAIHERV